MLHLYSCFAVLQTRILVTVQTGAITSVWAIADLGVYLGDVSQSLLITTLN